MQMEKKDCESSDSSEEELKFQAKSQPNTSMLLDLIPPSVTKKCKLYLCGEALLFNAIQNLHLCENIQDLNYFFREIGAERNVWASQPTVSSKAKYIFSCLDINVQKGLQRMNAQADEMIKTLSAKPKSKNSKTFYANKSSNSFEWLHIRCDNEMLKSKLKIKLVQTINEFKNEKKLREVMNENLPEDEKIHLQDDSFEINEDDKKKINFQWTEEDQKIFLKNIQKLKQKFTKTEFLKNCHRYKFISNSELMTLAAEDISRRLDKNSKAFLSREFLLDNYFSAKSSLTEKQMKFILKTSPMLSKCVDKAFIRAAVRNIKYEDIDKMELQIAEEIINKFEAIRSTVRRGRRQFKQIKNKATKQKIQRFQKKQKRQEECKFQKQNLHKHKVKMIRNLNYKSCLHNSYHRPIHKKNKNSEKEELKKILWPLPMNNGHPSTGIFVRDCNEQCEELNEYEKDYSRKICNGDDTQKSVQKKNKKIKKMINFYSGGPLQNCPQNSNAFITNQDASLAENPMQRAVKVICNTFKVAHYNKCMTQKLQSISMGDILTFLIQQNLKKNKTVAIDLSTSDNGCKTKKSSEQLGNIISQNTTKRNLEQAVKNKLIQGKERSKMAVYIKKLLILAAENSFLSIKALNAKFSPVQINSTDKKGNTALFYATKNKNREFIDYLLDQKADVNVKCEKGKTPLHNAFKSGDYQLICKCLIGHSAPDLNVLDNAGKTPLAYCPEKIIFTLGLENGVVSVPLHSISNPPNFDNNALLCKEKVSAKINVSLKRRKSNIVNGLLRYDSILG